MSDESGKDILRDIRARLVSTDARLAGFDSPASEREPPSDSETEYDCDHCDETFSDGLRKGQHLMKEHSEMYPRSRSGGLLAEISDENAFDLMTTMDRLPADSPTSTMLDPFVDFQAAPALTKLHDNGVVDRYRNGNGGPFKYEINETGREFMEEYDGQQ